MLSQLPTSTCQPRTKPSILAWIHRLTLSDHFRVAFGVVDHDVWLRACEYRWSVQRFHCVAPVGPGEAVFVLFRLGVVGRGSR
jgi:hypothetical protein